MEEISLKVERGAGKSAPTHSTLKIPLFPANLIILKVRHLFKQDPYVFHNKMVAKWAEVPGPQGEKSVRVGPGWKDECLSGSRLRLHWTAWAARDCWIGRGARDNLHVDTVDPGRDTEKKGRCLHLLAKEEGEREKVISDKVAMLQDDFCWNRG